MKVAFFLAKYVSLLLLTLLLAAAVRGACQQDFLLLLRQTFVENLTATVCTPWFALTAGILLLMGLLRGVTAIWNMTYTLGLTLLVFLICLALLGPTYTLPGPLSELPQLSFLSSTEQDYPALLYLVPIAAVLGGLFSNSRLRITFYSLVSYALWYGLSELLLYLLMLWGQSDDPVFPEMLVLLSDSSWIIPAVLGVFFLIYTVVLAFYETYSPRPGKGEHRCDDIPQELTEREMPEALTAAELNPSAVNLVPDVDPTAPLHPGVPPMHSIGHAPVCTPEEQSMLPTVPPPAPPVPVVHPHGAQALPPTAASLNAPARPAPPAPTAKAAPTARAAMASAPATSSRRSPVPPPPPLPSATVSPIPATAATRIPPTAASQIVPAPAVAAPAAPAPAEAAPSAGENASARHDGDSAIAAALAALPAEDSSDSGAADQTPTVPLPPTETFAEIRAALSDMKEAREEAEQHDAAVSESKSADEAAGASSVAPAPAVSNTATAHAETQLPRGSASGIGAGDASAPRPAATSETETKPVSLASAAQTASALSAPAADTPTPASSFAAASVSAPATNERPQPAPIPPTAPVSTIAPGHVASATQKAPYVPLPPEGGERS